MPRPPRKNHHSARPAKPGSAFVPSVVEARVEGIGARGDGLARCREERLFIPLTVPGDQVTARVEARRGEGLAAELVQILEAGPDRVEPPCPHFGTCGGCVLQHWAGSALGEWKRGLLVEAVVRAGFPAEAVRPIRSIAPGTRRRATFAFSRRQGKVRLGFNERASHRLADLDSCLLLAPALSRLLSPLRALLAEMGEDGEGDIAVTLTETGADVVIFGPSRLDLFARERLAVFAEAQDLARLSWGQGGGVEPVAARRQPVVRFAGTPVVLPPGAFLQPSPEGERTLAGLVFDGVGEAGRVADLFAGCGSFSFPLAQKAEVFAVEGDEAALGALARAAAGGRARVVAERRDLARNPLAGPELARFEAVVFDPPRAGAATQAEALAAAGPAVVVAVSCNPATLARDARLLKAGGYCLQWAVPVDQFPYSAHVEAVAAFRR